MDNNLDLNLNNEDESYDKKLDIREEAGKSAKKIIKEMSGIENKHKRKLLNNTISFMSTSGGAGASTLVASVGKELADIGYSVLIIDLDIMYPSQGRLNNIPYSDTKCDLVGCVTGEVIGKCIRYNKNIGVICSENRTLIDYVSCDNKDATTNFEEALNRLAYLFDVILIDCPNQLHFDLVNTALYRSDNIYLVLDDGAASLVNIPRLINNFEITGIHTKKIRYIMNKRTSFHYSPSNLKAFNIEVSNFIPFEMGVLECSLKGKLFSKDGESTGKSSKEYVKSIKALVNTVLVEGGASSNE